MSAVAVCPGPTALEPLHSKITGGLDAWVGIQFWAAACSAVADAKVLAGCRYQFLLLTGTTYTSMPADLWQWT